MKSRLLFVACATETIPALSTRLMASGHRVRFTTCGMELLKKARRRQPDLIILDSHLPDMQVSTVCEIMDRVPWIARIPRLHLGVRAGFSPRRLHSPGHAHHAPILSNSQELLRQVHEMLHPSAIHHPWPERF